MWHVWKEHKWGLWEQDTPCHVWFMATELLQGLFTKWPAPSKVKFHTAPASCSFCHLQLSPLVALWRADKAVISTVVTCWAPVVVSSIAKQKSWLVLCLWSRVLCFGDLQDQQYWGNKQQAPTKPAVRYQALLVGTSSQTFHSNTRQPPHTDTESEVL